MQEQIEAARTVLIRLLQVTALVESRHGSSRASQLVAVNEQLVLAALRAQTEAEAAVQALSEVAQLAEHDPLTQLPNRVLLRDRLAHAMANARRRGTQLALLFLDLDNFKQINDTLGHPVGDEVLKLAARRLAASIRAGDTLSRHGGDEFLILLTEVSEPLDAAKIAKKLLDALGAPISVGDHLVRLTASVGISLYPDDAEDAEMLIARADVAMYRGKRSGRSAVALYTQTSGGVQDL